MNRYSSTGQVDLEKQPELGQPEVGGAVAVVDRHRLTDLPVLEATKLAVRLLPEDVELGNLGFRKT